MYCYQCEQTAKGQACTVAGVCGKTNDTANLQDALIHSLKGISWYSSRLAKKGIFDKEADLFVVKALFTTVTNVNFDEKDIAKWLKKADIITNSLADEYNEKDGLEKLPEWLTWERDFSDDGVKAMAKKHNLEKDLERYGDVNAGLYHLVLYGLKGMAAYADHAQILGVEDQAVYNFFHETMDFLSRDKYETDELVGKSMAVGEENIKVMEMLDRANTGTYGHPEPTNIRISPVEGKAILVSGHDLKDLEELLKQTEGKGINIYTHGEMLPCNAYPGLKKYKHLVGNYGGAWQDQAKEFDAFPGSILMTTNCIQKPRESYKERIFTTGLVQWPGVKHVENYDFSAVIDAAISQEGFKGDFEEKYIMGGFARNAVLSVADKVIDGVKNGDIRHFFLVGGCDGAKSGRNYYTEFVEKVPEDCIVLTLACGKYRFNKMELGDIGGIPRLLDIGQCNDAYSAVKIALALADAFDTDINSLPLSLVLSWYEQKAVVILLSLLHLGVKNMKLGPTVPAFLKAPVIKFLQDNFNLQPISDVETDMKEMLGEKEKDV